MDFLLYPSLFRPSSCGGFWMQEDVTGFGRARRRAATPTPLLFHLDQIKTKQKSSARVPGEFGKDSFAHFKATRPGEAKNLTGCVVLTEQFRFGEALTELANRVAYDGLLSRSGSESGEIVVVTVDGLPEQLRRIDHSEKPVAGWWPIGAPPARASMACASSMSPQPVSSNDCTFWLLRRL